jgi:hypothetical protein
MTQTPSNAALIDDALAAVHEVMARMARRPDIASPAAAPVSNEPSQSPSLSTAMSSTSPESVVEQVAIQHYLSSVSLLLDASLTLISQSAQSPSFERSRQWSALIQQTRTAGRMVYGAALALADPGAATSSLSPVPVSSPRA